MATPKRRVSHAATASRKAQWLGALSAPAVTTCPHCGEVIMTYRACSECGYYRGRKAVEMGTEEA
ncbi:50S ribosomal protein L32 [Aminithiophilus ramosus]|uniref:Large ribosomal subunit protein bL32 n=2 Tax=Synergistales TaxID=649776 RepID=A0A9Q7F086_9BACT|nr:50S ribosomal protein L32 [Aminithiophilus ramosus]QTX32922.1 50S ribosomal protein L32 [Aminithiophilus ramosus]QVL37313.1 50S ribosomal protein L32 [Synergistota bacterium]